MQRKQVVQARVSRREEGFIIPSCMEMGFYPGLPSSPSAIAMERPIIFAFLVPTPLSAQEDEAGGQAHPAQPLLNANDIREQAGLALDELSFSGNDLLGVIGRLESDRKPLAILEDVRKATLKVTWRNQKAEVEW